MRDAPSPCRPRRILMSLLYRYAIFQLDFLYENEHAARSLIGWNLDRIRAGRIANGGTAWRG